MLHFILLNTADDSIGLLDKASLSQQALMELVVQGVTNNWVIRGDKGESAEMTEWYGVTLEHDMVTQIDWIGPMHGLLLRGVLHMECLPLTVRSFTAIMTQLTGTMDLSHLPNVTDVLNLSGNDFLGPIDLHRLPTNLEKLSVADNQLSGSVDLTRLPANLEHLLLFRNRFNGSVDLTNLPSTMTELWLHKNLFSGTVDLTLLPRGMKRLALSDNELSGEVCIAAELFDKVTIENTKLTKRILEIAPLDPKHVPRCWQTSLMDQFYASISEEGKISLSKGNPYHDYCEWIGVKCDAGVVKEIDHSSEKCGNFDVHSLSPTVEKIEIDYSRQKYTLQTRALPRELQFCSLTLNQLFGSVDLRTLPRKLVRLSLSYNNLSGPITLTRLPCSLKYLNLERNRIVQSVVYYDHLPPNVEVIRLISPKTHRTNRIGVVCAVHPDMAVENKAIFKPMPKRNVR